MSELPFPWRSSSRVRNSSLSVHKASSCPNLFRTAGRWFTRKQECNMKAPSGTIQTSEGCTVGCCCLRVLGRGSLISSWGTISASCLVFSCFCLRAGNRTCKTISKKRCNDQAHSRIGLAPDNAVQVRCHCKRKAQPQDPRIEGGDCVRLLYVAYTALSICPPAFFQFHQ